LINFPTGKKFMESDSFGRDFFLCLEYFNIA